MPTHRNPVTATHIALAAATVLTALLYATASHGPFFLDDFVNLVSNNALRPADLTLASLRDAALSSDAGVLKRPIAMLSFTLNYAVSPATFGFKIVNISLHLCAGVMIFFLARRLLPRLLPDSSPLATQWIAIAIAAWWLLHPLHASTVLYIVQRMTQLSALFTLLGALVYIHGRERVLRDNRGYIGTAIGVTLCGVLAVFSKENGALLPTLLLVIEVCAYRFALPAQAPRWVRPALYASLWLPTLAILAYLAWEYVRLANGPLPGRLFSLDERLLSEARILWQYLGWLLLLAPEGIGLFHDQIAISRGLLSPITTAPAVFGWCAAVAFAWYSLRTQHLRHIGFGVLWFLAAHLLESTTLPLELAFEHRNYLAAFGPLLAVSGVLLRLHARLRAATVVPAVFAALIGLSAWLLTDQITAWRSAPALAEHLVTQQPESPRAWATLSQTLIASGRFDEARLALDQAAQLAPYEVGYPFGQVIIDCLQRAPIPPARLSAIEDALATSPNTAYSNTQFQNLITHCVARGQREDAALLAIFALVEQVDDDTLVVARALAHYFHGRAERKAGNIAAARRHWETVLSLDSEAVLPALDLATLLIDMGESSSALPVLEPLRELPLTGEEEARLHELGERLARP